IIARPEIDFGEAVLPRPADGAPRQLHAGRVAVIGAVVRDDPEMENARAAQTEGAGDQLAVERQRKEHAAERRAAALEALLERLPDPVLRPDARLARTVELMVLPGEQGLEIGAFGRTGAKLDVPAFALELARLLVGLAHELAAARPERGFIELAPAMGFGDPGSFRAAGGERRCARRHMGQVDASDLERSAERGGLDDAAFARDEALIVRKDHSKAHPSEAGQAL